MEYAPAEAAKAVNTAAVIIASFTLNPPNPDGLAAVDCPVGVLAPQLA